MALLRRIAELESRLVETESFMNSEPGALIQDLEVSNSQLVMGVLWYFLTNYSLARILLHSVHGWTEHTGRDEVAARRYRG